MARIEGINENRENKTLRKIYFLVHPGFLSDARNWKNYSEKNRNESSKKYRNIPDLYTETAKAMGDGEVMIAFAHRETGGLKEDFHSEEIYIKTLKELKNILGDRFIVISNKIDVTSDPEIFGAVERLLNSRGFICSKNVCSEILGESLITCASKAGKNLRNSGKLRRKPIIRTKKTEGVVENYSPATIRHLQKKYKELKYVDS